MRILISFLSITVSSFAFASSLQADSYKVQQVAEGIFYHQGSHQEADAENLGAIANVGFRKVSYCVKPSASIVTCRSVMSSIPMCTRIIF